MNNEEKNTYVREQLTGAMLALLKCSELSEISISQITEKAQVSRNSFYRNYASREDILMKHVKQLLAAWAETQQGERSNAQRYGSLFAHLKEHSELYLLLKERGLFHLVLDCFIELFGAKPVYDNMTAYVTSFLAYGTFGWIEEWLARGMQESAEAMAEMLAAYGMK